MVFFKSVHFSLPILFDLGFLTIGFWDVVDIVVVGVLIYQVYKLLRGSIAFNIFVGMVLLYLLWWIVRTLKMDLLSLILGQFVSVGVVIVAVIFQPEIRRFLLFLGNTTLRGRYNFWNTIAGNIDQRKESDGEVHQIMLALKELSARHTGALIILANNLNFSQFGYTGVVVDAHITKELLVSIFNKESPLHDGAVIISQYKIHVASCVLPVSENPSIPQSAGLRHRAALGISETANVTAFVVSEENGKISFARQGRIRFDIDEADLEELLMKYYL